MTCGYPPYQGVPKPTDRMGKRCVALNDDLTCAIYANRPSRCREFEVGGEKCLELRKQRGID
jgi:Fe-S-cluster containining protein